MNYYFITGTSSGIGRAVGVALLDHPENIVYGFSRSSSIDHLNYHHIFVDLSAEESLLDQKGFRIFSIAPGIVDTPMQEVVRNTESVNFSHVDRFIRLKNENNLSTCEKVACKYLKIIENFADYSNTVFQL